MPLVSSVVLPHGAMVFDGADGCSAAAAQRLSNISDTMREDFRALYRGSYAAAELAKASKPDVILLNTPHGVCLSNTHCVYLNKKAKGNAEWNDQWTEYDVSVDLDSDLSRSFLDHLQRDGIAAEGMNAFAACEAPLRWGEVIPLWFFRDLTAAGVKVVIYSNPLSRSKPSPGFEEITRVGSSVSRFLSSLKERVLYLVSGDLAHSHTTDCTVQLYLPDPRWNMPKSDTALPFDICIENWLRCAPYSPQVITGPIKMTEEHSNTLNEGSIGDAGLWLSRANDMKTTALACGIYGFCILHGMLRDDVGTRQASYTAHCFCRLAPTYYGMAAAVFIEQ